MSTIDSYESVELPRRHKSHRHREREYVRDEPRYVEKQETYVRNSPVPAAPEPPYVSRQTDLIRRPIRGDSDLSIEEVRRDFPPPTSATYSQQRTMVRDDRYGPPRRARSAERERQYQVYTADPRRSGDIVEERRSRKTLVAEEHARPRQRSLSRNQKIIAAVGGAALAVGGKELYDRRRSHGLPVERNPLSTAAVGAAGALAAYEGAELYVKHGPGAQEKVKKYMAVDGPRGPAEYYSSEDETVQPKRSKSKSRRKSIVEGALGLAGLGAAAGASRGRSERGSRRGRDDSYDSYDSRRSKSRGGEGAAKFQQAAKAALLAGATEAFRVRKEPGGWGGEKGKRILTAAIGAGGIDAAADRDPEHKSKRHILEAVVGGLAGNRLINGSRNEVDDKSSYGGRARSRSRSRGPSGGGSGLAALATAGIGALASKKLLDSRERSRSRSRAHHRRSSSSDPYDSRSPSPRRGSRRHRRSKSVTDYARKGLAAIGLGEGVEAERDHRRGDIIEETRVVKKKSRRGGSDDGFDGHRRSRHGPDAAYGQSRDNPYDSSLGSSDEDERKVRKMKAPRY